MAYIASRALAFTKLPWEAQWEVLHSPAKALLSDNFQLPSIVQALREMIGEVSLWTVLSSPPWSSFIFQRLHGHKNKLGYSFLSDGMPMLDGKLPFSDIRDKPEDVDARTSMQYVLNRKLPIPTANLQAYLEKAANSVPPTELPPFSLVCVHLMLAVSAVRGDGNDAVSAAQHSVELAGKHLRAWAFRHDYGDLFFTHWPVLRLLALIAMALAEGRPPSLPWTPSPWRAVANEEGGYARRVLLLACNVGSRVE
eukprot:CAMPEP_0203923390 /NCGR_PEP_ID=MMETSP0359-20131031/63309_1 /ASSEMBLY_ACC=CAM_ASM_000338 /TAXON_ID=268821 /ORGANISM="Scrippsiella Hangoei, Strain SHTV-5" /LENGTH=252 /DNA_ID=CAMNT_0050851465 /DNA_START=381 /DNA_END=1136 /DNA_ORIENTATION=+